MNELRAVSGEARANESLLIKQNLNGHDSIRVLLIERLVKHVVLDKMFKRHRGHEKNKNGINVYDFSLRANRRREKN